MKIRIPSTKEEFERYYKLRWEILRKPWNQPEGSEKDELEDSSYHFMAVEEDGSVRGVCRMHLNTAEEAQIRYMAVASNQQGKGVGAALLSEAEKVAKEKGAATMVLQARENALNFYLRNGYEQVRKTHLMYGEIQHYLMQKSL
jgi:N-acetylglutamate synthase-like GNAT family acetyltransferase